MRIERAVNYVTTLGPGRRLCIWVNGCPRKCEGCVSQRLQLVDEGTENDIYEYFFAYNMESIDGVTVSGGEPFMQADELLKLVEYLKRRGVSDILVYTGYTYEELLHMNNPSVNGVLEKISVLIDGPYVKALDFGKSNIKGSENQKIYYLDESVREIYENYITDERSVEEFILGNVLLGVGIPYEEYISEFTKK